MSNNEEIKQAVIKGLKFDTKAILGKGDMEKGRHIVYCLQKLSEAQRMYREYYTELQKLGWTDAEIERTLEAWQEVSTVVKFDAETLERIKE